MFVGDVKRPVEVTKTFRRKRVLAIDHAVKLVIRIQQVKHIVFLVGDVQVAFVVIDHALWSRDPVLFAEEFGHRAVSRYAEHFVLFVVANQKRSVRSQRDPFGGNQSFVFTSYQTLISASVNLPQSSGVIVGKKDVAFGVDYQLLRRRDSKARVKQRLQSIRFVPHFKCRAALVRQIELALVPDQSIRRSKTHARICGKDTRLVGSVGHQNQAFLLQLAGSRKQETDQDEKET